MPGKSILSKDGIVQDSPKDQLREQRIALQLTQQQVADRAGIKIQQYQKFESGERSIMTASFRVACHVLESLDMDITAFFSRKY